MAETSPLDQPGYTAPRAVPAMPATVTIYGDAPLRFTPNELAMVKEQTGHGLTEVAETDERWPIMAWLKLRREGYPDLRLDQLGDLEIEVLAEAPKPQPDPFAGR